MVALKKNEIFLAISGKEIPVIIKLRHWLLELE